MPKGTDNAVFHDPARPLQLGQFRRHLIRQEETIIFALIERAQFLHNPPVYDAASDEVFGAAKPATVPEHWGLLDFLLCQTERQHALVRRYTSPDEHAFFPDDLPAPVLPPIAFGAVLRPNKININPTIRALYERRLLPAITGEGSSIDQYGSSAVCDIAVLQALSARIHYGKYIAEAKFQANTERYAAFIRANDRGGIMAELTDLAVEERVLRRVQLKASTYGQDPEDAAGGDYKVHPDVIRDLYRDVVMPLTKEVQLLYLLARVPHPTVACSTASRAAALAFFNGGAEFTGDDVMYLVETADSAASISLAAEGKVCFAVLDAGEKPPLPRDGPDLHTYAIVRGASGGTHRIVTRALPADHLRNVELPETLGPAPAESSQVHVPFGETIPL
eukprot:TRINITY_DN42176_c0_g1_i1.p1 TRINITY_DN42176_c0_g1~~TRINITY_DN42176_c0_g1_i1.p1  ORF type:complete len:392 (+),score=79.44 TRINITY_DN42176_c0_g1_i1:20-1195(+)